MAGAAYAAFVTFLILVAMEIVMAVFCHQRKPVRLVSDEDQIRGVEIPLRVIMKKMAGIRIELRVCIFHAYCGFTRPAPKDSSVRNAQHRNVSWFCRF